MRMRPRAVTRQRREYAYGLDPDLSDQLGIRRSGFHGIFHERACADAVQHLGHSPGASRRRVLSICLEPQPEVAGVLGCRPVPVTGGITPLEGIPGQSTCGEVDPGIVLSLAKTMGVPEKINRVLTQESGLCGIVGEHLSLGEALVSERPEHRLARGIILYHGLQATGSVLAALKGWTPS